MINNQRSIPNKRPIKFVLEINKLYQQINLKTLTQFKAPSSTIFVA